MAASPAVTKKPVKQVGRPSIKRSELLNQIALRIRLGETLTSICNSDGMPTFETICQWRNADAEFSELLVRAREERAEAWADSLTEIADNCPLTHEAVGKARLQIQSRQYVMAKDSKRFADKNNETHVTSVTNNNLILLDEGRLKELQLRRQAQLAETIKDA